MKNLQTRSYSNTAYFSETDLLEKIKQACSKIAPVWPLDSFVAVNPYLGLAGYDFETAAHLLQKSGEIQMCMPLAFYREALQSGRISQTDLQTVLKNSTHYKNTSYEAFLRQLKNTSDEEGGDSYLHCFAALASYHSGKDLGRLMVNRISEWAAVYFDEGQALWKSSFSHAGIFTAWHKEAKLDLTPGIMGLKSFRERVKEIPDEPLAAIRWALSQLGVPLSGLETYLHCLLLRLGGWSAYTAKLDWDANIYGGQQGALREFLAILLCWEACLLTCLEEDASLIQSWAYARHAFSEFDPKSSPDRILQIKLVLQQALDRAEQQKIIQKLNTASVRTQRAVQVPKVQAIFCIDVRSEVYRRNLEAVSPDIETLGFAGFFAFPIRYVPTAHQQGQAQCPVLLPTGPVIHEKIGGEEQQAKAKRSRSLQRQVEHARRSFKLGAISCFSFVGPIGLAYSPKLFTDSFGLTRPVPHPEKKGLNKKQLASKDINLEEQPASGIPLGERISMAEAALQAMSLTSNFARLVLIVGHGSTNVNNPHASGLDCGACAGHSGESNARVAAAVLNDAEVRQALRKKGLDVPESTHFLSCWHDTTTDQVSIFNEERIPSSHQQELAELKKQLKEAGKLSRAERASRLQPGKTVEVDRDIMARSRDWSQVRPEWGLAGCSAFIVAPREHSKHIDLQGRSFLHSYDWKKDKDFSVLELIMTAPMVVTSWISLQYYASTVDGLHHGSGNKTLHNVTGCIGVLEGNGGDLRVGLPWQSVHDGEKLQHEPVRLNVCIAAPQEAMNDILSRHASVKSLCDHGWIHLLSMSDEGKVTHRYRGDLKWEEVTSN